jgi:hypothetical protein
VALVRVLRTAAVALSHVFYVDEDPTSATTGVTVAVTRLDGTPVSSGPATPGGPGVYTYTVPGQANLDTLVVTWTATSIGGAVVTATDTIEIVGGYLFGIAEARNQPPPLNATTYPTATLAAKRLEVEQECERICRQAFVPRFHRETLSGTGTDRLGLKHMMLRRLRSVTVAGGAWSNPDLTAVPAAENGIARRPAGAVWPEGVGNIVVEYEHGWDSPPEEMRMAGMQRLRSRLSLTSSGVPDRAVSWQAGEGGTYRISLPGKQSTGVAEVDAVYERYTRLPRAVFA